MPPISNTSPALGLPYILPSQAQKHVTHNEALQLLDVLVQLRVLSQNMTTPPGVPAEGDRYIIASGATGAWAGHDSEIAYYDTGGTWQFITPQNGWQARILDEDALVVYSGTDWINPDSGLQEFDMLGVNATPDVINRLSVSSPATLLNHAGSDHQLKLNKANAADTASLLFQTDWSGRAEMGLVGDDDFTIKVSADGSSFTTALQASRTTGKVTFPAGLDVTGALGGSAVQSAFDDATAGRLMKVGAFGLGGSGVTLTSADDLDDSRPNGFYTWTSNRPVNAPDSFCQMIHLERSGSNSRSQIIFRSGAGAVDTYFRGYTGGAWQDWRMLLNNANIVGPVSQSGGVPDGAVIEQGSNANGRWVKFADGTMQCIRDSLSVANVNSPEGSIFRSPSATWTYPATFNEAPVVSGAADDLTSWLAMATPGTTNVVAQVKSAVSTASTVNFRLVAHGRWDSF